MLPEHLTPQCPVPRPCSGAGLHPMDSQKDYSEVWLLPVTDWTFIVRKRWVQSFGLFRACVSRTRLHQRENLVLIHGTQVRERTSVLGGIFSWLGHGRHLHSEWHLPHVCPSVCHTRNLNSLPLILAPQHQEGHRASGCSSVACVLFPQEKQPHSCAVSPE